MDFERQIEPGIIKIYDMNVIKANLSSRESKNRVAIELRFIGMRDDEFNFDRCYFHEIQIKNPDPTSD